jgi:hypothetical protein
MRWRTDEATRAMVGCERECRRKIGRVRPVRIATSEADGREFPATAPHLRQTVGMQPFQRGQQFDNVLTGMSRVLRKYDRGVRADADIARPGHIVAATR